MKDETYWQNYWEKHGTFKRALSREDPFYVLTMFPYPSGKQLHLGHWFQYGMMDSWARFQKLKGKNVFQPMGFDAFGLPAENYAIKKGVHPQESTRTNIETMRRQFREMGTAYDWEHSLDTSSPEYYRWTQWLFIKLFRKGLAYQKEAPVNWCPQCNTVLANEQVIGGCCERCGSVVYQKNLKQWFFRITQYTEPLLEGLDSLDWPEKTKAMQRHWIGQSKGFLIGFKTAEGDTKISVFTTRPDTIFGVSYVVLAPDHPQLMHYTTPSQKEKIQAYQVQTRKKTELERIQGSNGKSGVFTGSYCIHPFTGEKLPVWIADYVLVQYGTGAVMGVPLEDERDRDFAKLYDLPIKDTSIPGEWSMREVKAHPAVQEKTTYRLRDWLVSRQRYWGAPIPVIHCPDCGAVAVPEEDLPVELPENVDFSVSGSPLAAQQDFVACTCPQCGKASRRETDTLDTFVCSSWYYLRFPDPHYTEGPFNREMVEKCLPVAQYCGGPEHACMHLLYSRFITRILYDLGYIGFQEPFPHLIHQGLILGENGEKMSKSKDSISPDSYVEEYGSDVLRLYLHFGFNFTEGGPWNEKGLKAVRKFVQRIHRFYTDYQKILEEQAHNTNRETTGDTDPLSFRYHNTLRHVSKDTQRFMFNTALARLMELLHEMTRAVAPENSFTNNLKEAAEGFPILLAPFAPHLAEGLWVQIGMTPSVFEQHWPKWDEKKLIRNRMTIAVMVNGKLRGEIQVESSIEEEELIQKAENHRNVQRYLSEKKVVKHIIIPRKLVNFIVK